MKKCVGRPAFQNDVSAGQDDAPEPGGLVIKRKAVDKDASDGAATGKKTLDKEMREFALMWREKLTLYDANRQMRTFFIPHQYIR